MSFWKFIFVDCCIKLLLLAAHTGLRSASCGDTEWTSALMLLKCSTSCSYLRDSCAHLSSTNDCDMFDDSRSDSRRGQTSAEVVCKEGHAPHLSVCNLENSSQLRTETDPVLCRFLFPCAVVFPAAPSIGQ